MAIDPSVQRLAEAFVRGELSAVQLHKLLSERTEPISSDLEGDLWGIALEVAGGETTTFEARHWLTRKHQLVREGPRWDLAALPPATTEGRLETLMAQRLVGLLIQQRFFMWVPALMGHSDEVRDAIREGVINQVG